MQPGAQKEYTAPWRFLLPWPSGYVKSFLSSLADRDRNFDADPAKITRENGWIVDGSDANLGQEPPGPPAEDGLFSHARQGIINYDFSDPRIVVGHFDAEAPLSHRNMVLEIKVLGLRYLSGVRVEETRETQDERQSVFGYRYDTLEGHFERGYEWFLLTKDHTTGKVYFKIEAHWLPGLFPNWWSRLGFLLVGQHCRSLWRKRAPDRLKELAKKPVTKATSSPDGLAHRGDETPQRSQTSHQAP